jgi:Xaa-Pro dipeptidase
MTLTVESATPISPAEYASRLARLREGMDVRGIDVQLVHIPENIYYLTGHQTVGYYAYQCLAVPLDGDVVLCLRGLERDLSIAQCWLPSDQIWGYSDTSDPVQSTIDELTRRGLLRGRVGLERDAWFLGLESAARLERAAGQSLDGSGLVERCRVVKSPAELAYIDQAGKATDAAIRAACETIAPGVTEASVAGAIFTALTANGSEYTSLPPFVASGERSALGHATWSMREIGDPDVVFLELAGAIKRYSAALIRTVFVGGMSTEQVRIHAALEAGLDAAMNAMRPGVTAEAVDAACRRPVDDAGYGHLFTHRAGYSIGINFPPDWGEGHIASLRNGDDFPLEPGMVFHVIPAVFVPGRYGIGLSKTLVVTDSGCRQVGTLGSSPIVLSP